MKNITPFKIICIGLPVILIVMVLLFSKGSDAKKERLESQLQTTWHSSEEGEYNEIPLQKMEHTALLERYQAQAVIA